MVSHEKLIIGLSLLLGVCNLTNSYTGWPNKSVDRHAFDEMTYGPPCIELRGSFSMLFLQRSRP